MTQDTSGPDGPMDDQPAVPERSGEDVAQAVERAAEGTPHDGVRTPAEQAKPHTAPVEQVRDDAAMTEGQVVDGPGSGSSPSSNPEPAAAGSGGAQSVVGARVSDRLSAGEQPPDGPPSGDKPSSDEDGA